MEDCGGVSLDKISKDMDLSSFLKIAIRIAEALEEIHKINIIHKDIKPSNIIVNPQSGEVKLIDFGVASRLSRENSFLQSPEHLEGTLRYMSPEQTGRINRFVDYRSDLYSLGATFYEILTGEPPFASLDSMELIHHHIAKIPVSPREKNKSRNIPIELSEIVMKLLAKNAEDRYQSSFGLKKDLEICAAKLDGDDISRDLLEFVPGKYDISDKFQIPQKLYGREKEIEKLLNSFEKVSFGQQEILFISGYSGMGKSSLVNEIQKPVLSRRGYFAEGKCDPLKRDVPYTPFIIAFQSLIRQVLAEPESVIDSFRMEFNKTLKTNARVLSEMIPELELIVGEMPSVPSLGAKESQNRFNLSIQQFVQIFARENHPLTLFLDDLQWADSASLNLLETLETNPDSKFLFIIGAYRNSEVDSSHPLTQTIDEIQKSGTNVESIVLTSLGLDSVKLLLSEALHCDPEKSGQLAELVSSKTDSNPFFVSEFLKTLYQSKLIDFDHNVGEWIWDLEKIEERDITDNVIELMSEKIRSLSEDTRQILQLGSCIGNRFDLKTISIVNENTSVSMADALNEAVEYGLLVPFGNAHQYLREEELSRFSTSTVSENIAEIDDEIDEKSVQFKFLHDRVHQAAYALIPEAEKPEIHLRIGRYLLSSAGWSEVRERLIEIVGHLNLGLHLLQNESERMELADLNFKAGMKAKTSAAFTSASNHFRTAINIIGDSGWESHYERTLSIYSEAMETEYLDTSFEKMEEFAKVVIEKSRSFMDTVRIFETRLRVETAQAKYLEAIDIAREILGKLGLKIPANASKLDVITGLVRTKLAIGTKSINDLENLPELMDPKKLSIMNLLMRTTPPAYMGAPNLFPVIVFNMLIISIRYGNSPISAYAYCVYGLLVMAILGDIETGYEYGKMSIRLLEKLGAHELKNQILMPYNAFIKHWKEHLAETKEAMEEIANSSLESGDLEYSSYAAIVYCTHSFLCGDHLPSFLKKADQYLTLSKKLKQEAAINNIRIIAQLSEYLSVSKSFPEECLGEIFQKEHLTYLIESKNFTAVAFFYYASSVLDYMSENYEKALENSNLAESHIESATGLAWTPDHTFYRSLILLRLYPSSPKALQRKYMKIVLSNQKKMRKWAKFAPMNHLHKFKIVEAERMSVLKKNESAENYYELAMRSASANNYTNMLAVASERAAVHYFSVKKDIIGRVYLLRAHYFYTLWGALAIAKKLEETYPEAFVGRSEFSNSSQTTVSSSQGSFSSKEKSSRLLDVTSIFKASQALSGEIVLDKLLDKVMNIAIENAGAETGLLILDRQGNFEICARGSLKRGSGAETKELREVTKDDSVPGAIFEYVRRTGKTVVIQNAQTDENFASIPYIIYNKPKSIICLPIRNQGKFLGIVYLENNLTTGAFTPDRIDVLEILSAQAAISIENALLYSSLEAKVKERTVQLESAVHDLNQTNSNLEGTLTELHTLKQQQDGDYFLTSLLMKPLCVNYISDDRVKAEFAIKQKKEFQFKKWNAEIGGDLCSAHTISLRGKKYTVFLNADAMGKSMQGAGGALVFGSVFEAMIERVKLSTTVQDQYPERWLKNAFTELDKIFKSFDGSMFVSCVIGLIDNSNGYLYCFNAEHPWVALYRDNRASFLQDDASMFKLGTFANEDLFLVHTYQLFPGDSIFIGSDGKDDILLKSKNGEKGKINEDETLFLECVDQGRGKLSAIRETLLDKGEFTDDFSILKLTYAGPDVKNHMSVSPQIAELLQVIRSEKNDLNQLPSHISELKKYLSDHANSIPVLKSLVRLHLRLRQYEEASQYALLLSSHCPWDTKTIFTAAQCFRKTGDFKNAADLGERLRLRDPQNPSVLSFLANLYQKMGNQKQAEVMKAYLKNT